MNPRLTVRIALFLMFWCPFAQARSVLISNVNVIDVVEGRVLDHQDVRLNAGLIESVREHGSQGDAATVEVDGTDRFLIPGLWDMHVHFRTRKLVGDSDMPALVGENESLLDVYIAHGITSVFDMGSDIPDRLLEWKTAIEHGDRTGPNLYLTGRKIEGAGAEFAASIEIVSRDDVDRALRDTVSAGYEGVKVMALWIEPELLDYLLDEARKRGLKTFVHALETIPATQLSDSGFSAFAHMDNLLPEASANFPELVANVNGRKAVTEAPGDYYWDLIEDFFVDPDASTLRNSLDRLARNRTAVVSTFNGSQLNVRLDRVHQEILAPLSGIGPLFAHQVNERYRRKAERGSSLLDSRLLEANKRLLTLLPESDVLFLIGTDSGYGNHAPGQSFHNELAALQEAGLEPDYILRAATLNAARFMNKQDREGSVSVGMRADLVLLDANPLQNIQHTRRIYAVFRDGQMMPRR